MEREAEQRLRRARQQLRRMGVSMFPDGMLLTAVEAAPVLGCGTFGTCYLVRVYADSRLVEAAVKMFHKKSYLRHVLSEASTYQKLTDVPRVPRLLGVSLAPLCIVTTMHGPDTMFDIVQRASTPPRHLLRALDQVAATLLKIHEKRLVHNDLKFDNVLISRTPGGTITATLIDMGAVRCVGSRPYYGRSLSAERYPYLAPEVLRGGPVSPCSDAFSLGWMLSGVLVRLPRSCTTVRGMEAALQCMHPDPSQRLSISSLRDAIRSLFRNSP